MTVIFLFILFHSGVALASVFPPPEKTKGDSALTHEKRSFLRLKRSKQQSPIIEKMTDEQLINLIDYMFEAPYMPPDLWGQVMMETAKRNLSKIDRKEYDAHFACSHEAGKLHIQKLNADIEVQLRNSGTMYFPAEHFYSEWHEDLSSLFKDEFKPDTVYNIELENSEFGCFHLPACGPISSPFGWRKNRYHKGIDIQLRKGDTVKCAFDGMVRYAQKKGAYGNVVIVRHYNGLETVYAHLFKIKVKEGQVIGAGDLIGLAGNTGRSTGPHLHFEVRFMGAPINPQYFISFDYGNLLFNVVELRKNKSGLLAAYHPETEFHVVERGETFAEIATRYGITTKKLRELNGMTAKQYIRLKKGMVIKVRELKSKQEIANNK